MKRVSCKHLLIDANNILHRAHYASRLVDRKGNATSGVYGVMKMMTPLLRQFDPSNVIIAWDGGKCIERLKIYPEYKAHRELLKKPKDKAEINRQRKVCIKLFDKLPVRQIMVDDVEADDVIGYLCERLAGNKIIVSNDSDFFQLVNEDTFIFNAGKQMLIQSSNIEEVIGFPVKYYILWKSIVGDSSDNIFGFSGIGPVKATKLIRNVLMTGKKLQLSDENQKILERNKYLIAIAALLTKSEIKKIRYQYKVEKKKLSDFKFIKTQFIKLGFRSLYNEFYDWQSNFGGLVRGKRKK